MFHSLSYWPNNINDYRLAEYCLGKSFPSGGNVRGAVVELGKKLRKNEPKDVVKEAFRGVIYVKHTQVWQEDPKRKGYGKYGDDTTLQGYFEEIGNWGEAEGLRAVS
jgi:hypothetical protein